MPKARTTVKPLNVSPEISPHEAAYIRGLHTGMVRKVNRIKQEIAKREALGQKLRNLVGQRDRRIAELRAEKFALQRLLGELLECDIEHFGEQCDHNREYVLAALETADKGGKSA